MHALLQVIGGLAGGYVVGAIPVAWLLVRRERGVDLRRFSMLGGGSLDVIRVAGWRTAATAIVLECIKGAAVGLAARLWLDQGWFIATAIAGCTIGDAFPVTTGMRRGGRGVVPLVTGLLVALPGAGTLVAIVAIPTAILTALRGLSTEYVIAIALPLGLLLDTRQWQVLLPAAVIVATLLLRRRQRRAARSRLSAPRQAAPGIILEHDPTGPAPHNGAP